MPMLIQLGVWAGDGGDYFVTHEFSERALDLLLVLSKKAGEGCSVNLDQRARDLDRLDWIRDHIHPQPVEDQETTAPARPPVGAAGRMEPVNALAKRVMGTPRKNFRKIE